MRANKCEVLDEIEEWMLIMRHYCFIVAGRTSCSFLKMGGSNKFINEGQKIASESNDIVKLFCSVQHKNLMGFKMRHCTTRS